MDEDMMNDKCSFASLQAGFGHFLAVSVLIKVARTVFEMYS